MSADIERLEKAVSEVEESKTDLERKNKETSDALKIAKRSEGDLTKLLKNRDSQLATTQKEHYEECKKATEKMSNYKKKSKKIKAALRLKEDENALLRKKQHEETQGEAVDKHKKSKKRDKKVCQT